MIRNKTVTALVLAGALASSVLGDTITCDEINEDKISCNGKTYTMGDHLDTPWTTWFYIDCGIALGLVLVAGLVSGLTMGLMSMDRLNLKIMINGQDEKNKRCATKILPLVERHHLLLVTLLLTNACAAEALPIFLDRLVHPVAAVAISVTMVLLFGEIIPQAVCTRFGLQIGAALSWVVWGLIGLLFPLAWPISKLLDFVLGHENGTFFRRAELKELVHLHAEDIHVPFGENLTYDEVRIIKGALDMKEKSVGDVITPADKIFAVNIDDKLDRDMLLKIVESGHHRIPVYHSTRDHFIGMILIQDLVLLNPADPTPVRNLKLYRVPIVDCDMPLYEMLHQFQTGRSHMAVVLDPKDHITPMGILTLEDVMEELLQEEILDEEDVRLAAGEDKYELIKDVRLASRLRRGSVLPGEGRRPSVFVNAQGSGQIPNYAIVRKPSVAFPANPHSSFDGRRAPPELAGPYPPIWQGGAVLKGPRNINSEQAPLLRNAVVPSYATSAVPPVGPSPPIKRSAAASGSAASGTAALSPPPAPAPATAPATLMPPKE